MKVGAAAAAAAAELCILLFTTSCLLHVSSGLHSIPYDYSATTQAMPFPYLFLYYFYIPTKKNYSIVY
jgi:succinate dehydrogenase hydrophobic anchor subunit